MAEAASLTAQQVQPQKLANRRTERDFARARLHSRVVGTLRYTLPILAALILVAFLSRALVAFEPSDPVSNSGAEFDGERLVMKSPRMSGFNGDQLPYDVIAERAIQNVALPDVVELEQIIADLPLSAEDKAKVKAVEGTYFTDTEKLELRKRIEIRDARGMDIDLGNAKIDMRAGTLSSDQPVEVRSATAQINADSVEVSDNGKRIVFKDRVRMVIDSAAVNRNRKESPQKQEQDQ